MWGVGNVRLFPTEGGVYVSNFQVKMYVCLHFIAKNYLWSEPRDRWWETVNRT